MVCFEECTILKCKKKVPKCHRQSYPNFLFEVVHTNVGDAPSCFYYSARQGLRRSQFKPGRQQREEHGAILEDGSDSGYK